MKTLIFILWVLVGAAACVATYVLVTGMQTAETVFQQGVTCSYAVAIVVIPYIFTRAIEGIDNTNV